METKTTLTKDELKKRVDEAISRENGVSVYNDCKYFKVRVTPNDCFLKINIVFFGEDKDYTQQILDNVPDEYRAHITGLRNANLWKDAYELQFDSETQNRWNAQMQSAAENYFNMYNNL